MFFVNLFCSLLWERDITYSTAIGLMQRKSKKILRFESGKWKLYLVLRGYRTSTSPVCTGGSPRKEGSNGPSADGEKVLLGQLNHRRRRRRPRGGSTTSESGTSLDPSK